MSIIVATSYVADGTMNDRTNPASPQVVASREKWLKSQGVSLKDTIRIKITYDEPENDYCRYREVDEGDKGLGMLDGDIPPADGLVTTQKGVALFLPVADCVATTFYDEQLGILMLSHLGRQSLEQNGGYKSAKHLEENYSCDPKTLKVWLSATVNKEAYKIFKLNNKGMKEAVYEQLLAAGINPNNIIDNQDDTATDDRYFSHSEYLKGNKPTDGTFAMLAMMRD